MSASATIPFTAPQSQGQPWTPTNRDRLIFQWVKFDGHKQSWVAEQLEIHQTTVSRIVERYERWIARGGQGQQGSPSHDERLRAQRWLAYERNEWILSSALRIAGEMERALDTSRSTITRPISEPNRESEVRTEHKVIDRSGIAARFLRLAYRINMDQLKLVEQEPLPALEPLTIEDLGENAFPALANTPDDTLPDTPAECHGAPAHADRDTAACSPVAPSNVPSDSAKASATTAPPPRPAIAPDDTAVISIDLSPDSPPMPKTHKLIRAKPLVNASPRTTSTNFRSPKKSSAAAYAVASSPPETAACPQSAPRSHPPAITQMTNDQCRRA